MKQRYGGKYMDKILEQIAKEVLGIDTLKTRKSGDLDFYEVSVWQLKSALEKAYDEGKKYILRYARVKNI